MTDFSPSEDTSLPTGRPPVPSPSLSTSESDAAPPDPLPAIGSAPSRRLHVGAEVVPGGAHFRVWAPNCRTVEVARPTGRETPVAFPLEAEGNGYFAGLVPALAAGDRYAYRLDGGPDLYADPASRFQPDGPMGPSEIVDPGTFAWTDAAWSGVPPTGRVAYEMHIGTFTPEGTWRAAAEQLPALAALGVNILELMPVADFTGRFGWGYDGVNLFAPTRLYGNPDEFRAFVDRAHDLGLSVILDVVYNHLGPVGNFLPKFSETYFSEKHSTDWGKGLNFDGDGAEPVREFFAANAAYWIDEFHLDGLRLDATQNIYDFDETHEHILAMITRAAHQAARGRRIFIVAENEPQDVRMVRPREQGGMGIDAMWNDDLHHAAMVALTGRAEAYYTDYRGSPQELVSAAKYGFLYQGQWYKWQKQPRGTPTWGIDPATFVTFVQNHDQVANSGTGQRIHVLTSPGRWRAMTAYILLIPGTPMLFMGQEFAASAPFLYFADHEPELAELVHNGRKEFLQQFRSLATDEMQETVERPDSIETFERCKLDPAEREKHAEAVRLHTDLLALRREDAVFASAPARPIDGAVLGPSAFVLRFFGDDEDRLLLVNLDVELHLDPAPEPLLAPRDGRTWDVLWSSESAAYGGTGTPRVYSKENWRLPGASAIVMRPADCADVCDPEPRTEDLRPKPSTLVRRP